jgi:hypothetical protein
VTLVRAREVARREEEHAVSTARQDYDDDDDYYDYYYDYDYYSYYSYH